jgi:hypothetical protein
MLIDLGDERLVGLGRREDQPDEQYGEEGGERGENREPNASCEEPRHSSVLNSPVRLTTSTAATSPIAECDWTSGPDGVPLLAACPRRLVGTVLDRFDLGDHTGMLLAPVAQAGGAGPPLMFSMVRDIEAGHPV